MCIYYENTKINVHVLMCIDITMSLLFSHFHSNVSELDGYVYILQKYEINVHVLMCIDITTSLLFSHFHSDVSELDGYVYILQKYENKCTCINVH